MFSNCAHRNAAIISEGKKEDPISTHPYLSTSPLKKADLLVPFSHIISALSANCASLIASNPPYVADGDPHLQQGDLRFEPAMALSCGPDGLDAIRTLAAGTAAYLRPSGWLLLEHGVNQGEAVRGLLVGAGFIEVETTRDLEDRDRVTSGRRP